jgi:site-specific recombinase XerD
MSAASPSLDPGDQSASRHPAVGSPSDRLALSALEAALGAARELGEDRPALEIMAGSLAEMGVRAACTTRSARLLTRDRDAWLLRLRSTERSASSISAYRHAIDDLLSWAQRRERAAELFEERTIVDYLDEYRQRCEPAPATYHRRFLLLRRFMRWVSHRNGLPDPFLELQAPPKPRQESDWLTREEFVKLLHAAGHPPRRRPGLAERDQLVLLTLAMTGLRRSELIALDWGDVTLDGTRPSLLVRCGKGGKPRRQPLPTQLAGRLERLHHERCASPSDPVFCGLHGARLQPAILADIIRRASARAGITKHVTAHTLRHTAATWLRQATGDARLVAEYLGHADLSTVSRYAHVASEELHAATQTLADGPSDDRSPPSPGAASGVPGRDIGIHPEQLTAWE